MNNVRCSIFAEKTFWYNFCNSPSAFTFTTLNCSIPLQKIDRKRTLDIGENKTNGETESQAMRLTRSKAKNMTSDERARTFISLQDIKKKIRKGHSSNDKSSMIDLPLERDKENICLNSNITAQSKRKLENADNDRNIYSDSIHLNKKRKTADASEPVRKEKNTNQSADISTEFFRVGQVVWAKLRGFPCWPAKIERICGEKKHLIEIFWFNDYRRSKVFRSQIFDFNEHFAQFAVELKNHIGLETAAKEALMYLAKK